MATSSIAPSSSSSASTSKLQALWTATAITAGVTAASFALHQWASSNRNSNKKLPPGPSWYLPFLGETPEFLSDPLGYMWRRMRRYRSRVFRGHILGSEAFIISDMEWARSNLYDHSVASLTIPVPTFQKLLGNVNVESHRHKAFRKHQQIALGPQSLKRTLPQIRAIMTEHISKRWLDQCGWHPEGLMRGDLAVRNLFMALALGPLACCPSEGVVDTEELCQMAMDVQSGLFCAPIYFPGTTWYKAINTRDKYYAALAKMIARRFPPAYPGAPLRLESDTFPNDGVDMTAATMRELEESGIEMDSKRAAVSLAGNILGATETTGSTALGLLVVTAVRRDVQDKIRREQAALLKQSGPELSWADLSSGMPYTDAVVREMLRLLPVIQVQYRRLNRDVEIDGYTLPKGGIVAVSPRLASCSDVIELAEARGIKDARALGQDLRPPQDIDSDKWQETFRPERWLEEGEGALPKSLHLFGFAQHVCVGRDLAILELKMILAIMARHYTWSLPSCPKPHISFLPFLRVTNGEPNIRLTPAPL